MILFQKPIHRLDSHIGHMNLHIKLDMCVWLQDG